MALAVLLRHGRETSRIRKKISLAAHRWKDRGCNGTWDTQQMPDLLSAHCQGLQCCRRLPLWTGGDDRDRYVCQVGIQELEENFSTPS